MEPTAIIKKPMITEKATFASSEFNRYAFHVERRATKPQIKEEVEAIYDKKVVAVNAIVTKGKTKRWRGKPYKRSDFKKAVVTLAEGEMIDITSGI